jgi:hypothetical protein
MNITSQLKRHFSDKSGKGFIEDHLVSGQAKELFCSLLPELRRARVALYMRGNDFGPCGTKDPRARDLGRVALEFLDTDDGKVLVESLLADVNRRLAEETHSHASSTEEHLKMRKLAPG